MTQLLWALLFSLAFNIVLFIPAFLYKTDKLTDISYALSFIGLSIYAIFLSAATPAQIVLFIMILLWAMRLGGYLFIRINHMGRDKRFDGMREHFWSFSRFWVLQGLSVAVVLSSALLFWQSDVSAIEGISFIGLLIFVVGFLVETVADGQKWDFGLNPLNKGKWIESGLWGYTRHPNYLGEMLVWIGVFIYALPALQGWSILVGLISPVYIMSLLLFVSGVPLLEKSADKKWGDDPNYRAYKKRVPVLLPRLRMRP